MPMEPEQQGSHFHAWSEGYKGLLNDDIDARFRSLIYGWSIRDRLAQIQTVVSAQGAVWGFLAQGTAKVASAGAHLKAVQEAEFFVTANGAELILPSRARPFAVQKIGFCAISLIGSPIEPRGRLRYIDGCSNRLLVASTVAGDPCLNHLHFPLKIGQTHHTHPSTRDGIIARGTGSCTTRSGVVPLGPGLIFVIPANGIHGFQTSAETIDVIAYQPDSNHGPRHKDHPMVNRTLVKGRKINNSLGPHLQVEVIEGRISVNSDVNLTTSSRPGVDGSPATEV